MNFKKIVGFGDSWTYGDELLNPDLVKEYPDAHSCWTQNDDYRLKHCFLGQLGTHYHVPIENFGIPGGSLTSTQWTFQWWLDNESLPLDECLVLIHLTDSYRISHYNPNHVHYSNDPPWNKFVHSTWVPDAVDVMSEEFKTMLKQQMVLTVCPEWEKLNFQNSVLFFDGVAARKKLKLLQFNIPQARRTVVNVPTFIWPDECWLTYFYQNKQLVKSGGHPNEQGHRLMADRLISYIDSCTMYEC